MRLILKYEGLIKLILSILGPSIFILNYWYCEWKWPHPEDGWDIFIPMDKCSHNFWAVVLFTYSLTSALKTKYPITNYFLYLGVCLSFFDVWARSSGMSDYNKIWYWISLTLSFIIAGIIYGIREKYFNRTYK